MEAIMTVQTPLHAEHQLDQLAGQFAHWRQTRTYPQSPIPSELWAQAVALTTVVPPSRVAKQLRLRLADLKKQIAIRHATPMVMPSTSLSFAEVPLPPTQPPQPSVATRIELQRADGTRLCLPLPLSPPLLDALVRAFVEGRACCN
jgi:hypothetical protein